MTKDQWLAQRQKHSEVPWEIIQNGGWDAVPCNCGKEGCQGWRLARVEEQKSFNFDGPLRAA